MASGTPSEISGGKLQLVGNITGKARFGRPVMCLTVAHRLGEVNEVDAIMKGWEDPGRVMAKDSIMSIITDDYALALERILPMAEIRNCTSGLRADMQALIEVLTLRTVERMVYQRDGFWGQFSREQQESCINEVVSVFAETKEMSQGEALQRANEMLSSSHRRFKKMAKLPGRKVTANIKKDLSRELVAIFQDLNAVLLLKLRMTVQNPWLEEGSKHRSVLHNQHKSGHSGLTKNALEPHCNGKQGGLPSCHNQGVHEQSRSEIAATGVGMQSMTDTKIDEKAGSSQWTLKTSKQQRDALQKDTPAIRIGNTVFPLAVSQHQILDTGFNTPQQIHDLQEVLKYLNQNLNNILGEWSAWTVVSAEDFGHCKDAVSPGTCVTRQQRRMVDKVNLVRL